MRKTPLLFILVFCSLLNVSFYTRNEECDIQAIYKGITPASDTKAITSDDDVVEIETILVPTSLKEGKYKVELTRKGDNLYKISNMDIYLETRYCHEYVTSEGVTLIIDNNSGYTKGKIIFNE